ncbi:hypothetical protein [Chitinilyticum aquatile]|uniref:hypothetical protein n=1 Tax=Chitinilyticum aquatile TaxID=362520 RepID=UPI00040111CC|nr:hypothetical protein [Chitinilyticum aquatile]
MARIMASLFCLLLIDSAWAGNLGKSIDSLDAAAATMEAKIQLPPGAEPLKRYTRLYSVESIAGHEVLIAVYVLGWGDSVLKGSRVFLAPARMPGFYDGGCSVINVRYRLDTGQFLDVFCNGEA